MFFGFLSILCFLLVKYKNIKIFSPPHTSNSFQCQKSEKENIMFWFYGLLVITAFQMILCFFYLGHLKYSTKGQGKFLCKNEAILAK